jgi:hypothetical protein
MKKKLLKLQRKVMLEKETKEQYLKMRHSSCV